VVTGDDILIEYVKRIMLIVKQAGGDITFVNMKKLEQFLNHKVWYTKES
jgi:hypothetical protein